MVLFCYPVFIINTFYYIVLMYTDEVFMTLELDGENPPGVLSEVEKCRCAPLNQCDMKSSSDGISMIIVTTLFMYPKWVVINCNCPTQVQMIKYYLNCYNLWTCFYVFVFIILLILFRYISYFSFSVLQYFPLTPCLVIISYMFIK